MKTALNFLFPIRLRSGQAVFVSRYEQMVQPIAESKETSVSDVKARRRGKCLKAWLSIESSNMIFKPSAF